MLRFAVFLILFFASSSGSSDISEDYEATVRIVGGVPTTIQHFPYQISILQKEGGSFRLWCGGSIISNKWVLTAAHCFEGASPGELHLRAGSTFWDRGGKMHNVDRIILHPSFGGMSLDYDIAVLRISGTFHFSNEVKSIPLARKTPADGAWAVASGWGQLTDYEVKKPSQLHKVDIQIVNHNTCRNFHNKFRLVTARMLCAGKPRDGKNHCFGDSGGPLVVAGQQVGVASWVSVDTCANSIGVHANVANLRQWIRSTTGVH